MTEELWAHREGCTLGSPRRHLIGRSCVTWSETWQARLGFSGQHTARKAWTDGWGFGGVWRTS